MSALLLSLAAPPFAVASHIPASDISNGKPYVSSVEASPAYPDAGGAELTDGAFGGAELANGSWSGYDAGTPAFTIDLGTASFTGDINVTFLSNYAAAISPPLQVDFAVSADGVNFIEYGKQTTGQIIAGTGDQGIFRFSHRFLNANNARYVRVTVTRNGPEWVFLDEIEVTGAPSLSLAPPPTEIAGDTEVSLSAILTEFLDVDDLIEKAESAGASSVSLYVGYSGIAWFDIQDLSPNYGLIDHGDDRLLTDAIDRLHDRGIKVTAVLSSQLWGANPPPEAAPMLQDNGVNTTDLFDPQKSQAFFVELVDRVMDYNFDGVFLGEPYYKDATFHQGDEWRNERFGDFYSAVAEKIKARNPVGEHMMLLPVHTWLSQGYDFGAGLPDHGLPDAIKDVNFDYLGLDASTVYDWEGWSGWTGLDRGRFEMMLALTNRMAAGKKPTVQISNIKFGSSSETVPKEVVIDQIRLAKQYGMKRLQVFDYMYFDLYSGPDRADIYSALRNVNTSYSVSYAPRQIKVLSTRDAAGSADWRKYIGDQVGAGGAMTAGGPVGIALDEDLFDPPAQPVIESAGYNWDGMRVDWNADPGLTYNLDITFDNGATWTELVFRTYAGQASYFGETPSPITFPPSASSAKARLRAHNGAAYGPYTERVLTPVATIGAVSINGGAAATAERQIRLESAATDWTGQPPTLMRFRNAGGVWTSWAPFAENANLVLPAGDGQKTVLAQFRDHSARESTIVSDSIFLDERAPRALVSAPPISTKISRTNVFRVGWGGADYSPGLGANLFIVRYRLAGSGRWREWRREARAGSGEFFGVPGTTYYFQVGVRDGADNYGWSTVRRTIVPYNENQLVKHRTGFRHFATAGAAYYQGTVRYSVKRRDFIVYRFVGKSVGLLSTKGPDRSKAKIYIDGNHVKTLDNYSSRRTAGLAYYRTLSGGGVHYLKIVNLATPGRRRFDVDGLVVGR